MPVLHSLIDIAHLDLRKACIMARLQFLGHSLVLRATKNFSGRLKPKIIGFKSLSENTFCLIGLQRQVYKSMDVEVQSERKPSASQSLKKLMFSK